MYNKALIASIGLLVCSTCTWSVDTNLEFMTLRQKAMGGAGLASLKHDWRQMAINPASIVDEKGHLYLPLGLTLEPGEKGLKDISSALTDLSNSNKNNQYQAVINRIPSDFALKASFQPAGVTFGGFGIGVFNAMEMRAQILNPSSPKVKIQGASDLAPMMTYGTTASAFDMPLKVGISAKYVLRGRIINTLTKDNIVEKSATDILNGTVTANIGVASLSGISFDMGLLSPIGDSAQWGLVVHNIGGTLSGSYSGSNSETGSYSETLPMYLSLGYAQRIKADDWAYIGKVIGDFEYTADVNFVYRDIYKNIHMGLEKDLVGDIMSVRLGLNQGYPTIGLGFDLKLIRIQYAYSTDEKGSYIGDDPVAFHSFEINLPLY